MRPCNAPSSSSSFSSFASSLHFRLSFCACVSFIFMRFHWEIYLMRTAMTWVRQSLSSSLLRCKKIAKLQIVVQPGAVHHKLFLLSFSLSRHFTLFSAASASFTLEFDAISLQGSWTDWMFRIFSSPRKIISFRSEHPHFESLQNIDGIFLESNTWQIAIEIFSNFFSWFLICFLVRTADKILENETNSRRHGPHFVHILGEKRLSDRLCSTNNWKNEIHTNGNGDV